MVYICRLKIVAGSRGVRSWTNTGDNQKDAVLSHKTAPLYTLRPLSEHSIMAKYKEGDNFNHRNTIEYFEDSAKASLRAEI